MGAGADGRADTAVEFKGVAAVADKASAPVYLKIHGVVYDATEFKKRHPGGSVLNYYAGSDATDVYDNFHFRSKKADAFLKSLPVVEQNEGMIAPYKVYGEVDDNEEMLQDYRKWRQSLIDRGFFEPSLGHVTYRLCELVAIFALGTFCFAQGHIACGVALWGLFGGRAGWGMHEAGHNSFTGNITVDKNIQMVLIGLGLSTSADLWRSYHNKHHSSSNKESHDMDLDTTPLVAFFDTAIEKNARRKGGGYSPSWLKYQAYTFLPITSGTLVMLFWILFLHPKNVIKKKLWGEAFWMGLSHVLKTGIIHNTTGYSVPVSYCIFWAANWVAGVYLFGQFSLSHTFLPTVSADEHPTWVDYALRHTCDQNTQHPLVNWFQGLLNNQVSHHLYTAMPQWRQPQVSLEIEQFAKKWNRPYHHLGYFESWYMMFKNLDTVGKHYYEDAMEMVKND